MEPSVGKHFRGVVIHPSLKPLIDMILLAPSRDDPKVVYARRRMRALGTPATAYLYASEIRGYLEEKSRIGTEPWVFPVAGDLFLDAFEANLPIVGPNQVADHYSGMMGCYKQGDQPTKRIEGPLYVVDLLFERTLLMFSDRFNRDAVEGGLPLSFMPPDDADYEKRLNAVLSFADRALKDAVTASVRADRSAVPSTLLDYVGDQRGRIEKTLAAWRTFHRGPGVMSLDDEHYLERGLEVAEGAEYPPLVAVIRERLGKLHEKDSGRTHPKAYLEQSIHPLYEAGCIWLEQANVERESEAFDLALRRYGRGRAAFEHIRDRTSVAKVLVEQARAYIERGDDPQHARQDLYQAVRLVIAHMEGMPRGQLPGPSHDEVIRFLEEKGYHIEAEAYAAAVKKPSVRPESPESEDGKDTSN